MTEFVVKENYDLEDYIKLVAYLRSEKGCPWDRKQTHDSLKRNMIEESYECCEAIDEGDVIHMREELGDMLLQVLLHAEIAKEAGEFTLNDIANASCKKLVSRHTHVFGSVLAQTEDAALDAWENAKKLERSQKKTGDSIRSISKALPGLMRSEKIQNKAAKVGFDWPIVDGAMEKLFEEVGELQEGIDNNDLENIEEEIGDVLFSAVNVARFYNIDAEEVMYKACEKFTRRFSFIEDEAEKLGKSLEEMDLDEMETIYQRARVTLEGKTAAPLYSETHPAE